MSSTLVWLRDDLRLDDNPALSEAASLGQPLTVVYVLDEASPGVRPLGGAAKWWLHHSLADARRRTGGRGLTPAAAPRTGRRHHPGPCRGDRQPRRCCGTAATGARNATVDAGVKAWAADEGITAASFQANLMFEPWTVRTGGGRAVQGLHALLAGLPGWLRSPGSPWTPRSASLPRPRTRTEGSRPASRSRTGACSPAGRTGAPALPRPGSPGKPAPTSGWRTSSTVRPRNTAPAGTSPGVEGTSRLSAHLRFGEISPFRIWHALRERFGARGAGRRRDLPFRTRLAGVLLAAALRESGTGHPQLPARV